MLTTDEAVHRIYRLYVNQGWDITDILGAIEILAQTRQLIGDAEMLIKRNHKMLKVKWLSGSLTILRTRMLMVDCMFHAQHPCKREPIYNLINGIKKDAKKLKLYEAANGTVHFAPNVPL